VRLMTYNGDVDEFGALSFVFTFAQSGEIIVSQSISVVRTQLYRMPQDLVRVLLEVVFLCVALRSTYDTLMQCHTLLQVRLSLLVALPPPPRLTIAKAKCWLRLEDSTYAPCLAKDLNTQCLTPHERYFTC
jgi:hypothetical protein